MACPDDLDRTSDDADMRPGYEYDQNDDADNGAYDDR